MSTNGNCFFCDTECNVDQVASLLDSQLYHCKYCGKYLLDSRDSRNLSNKPDDKFKIACVLNEKRLKGLSGIALSDKTDKKNKILGLSQVSVDDILDKFPKIPSDVLNRTLLNLSRLTKSKHPFENIRLGLATSKDYLHLFARSKEASYTFLQELANQGYIRFNRVKGGEQWDVFCLTTKCWEKIESLQQTDKKDSAETEQKKRMTYIPPKFTDKNGKVFEGEEAWRKMWEKFLEYGRYTIPEKPFADKPIKITDNNYSPGEGYRELLTEEERKVLMKAVPELSDAGLEAVLRRVYNMGDEYIKNLTWKQIFSFCKDYINSQMPADRKLTLSDFKLKLDAREKEIFDMVINLVESSDIGLYHDISDESYVNIRLKSSEGKSDNVVAQLHRYGDEKEVALVVIGARKGAERREPLINVGEITKLSGHKKDIAGEKAWLNGNLPVKETRYKASVCVLDQNLINTKDIKSLLKWAVEEFDEFFTNAPIGVRFHGNMAATMMDDKTSSTDLLGRESLVQALANMFVHTKEIEGFTIALFGNWGVGKSTVMELLEKQLKKRHSKRFIFAKFNAWAYEKTDNIAAGLAQEVVSNLIKYDGFWAPVRQFWLKLKFATDIPKLGIWIILILLISLLLSFLASLTLPLSLQLWLTVKIPLIIKALITSKITWFTLAMAVLFLPNKLISAFKKMLHPIAIQVWSYLQLPSYLKHLGLAAVLKDDIKRLCKLRLGKNKRFIVFVDDLDRCQPKCIAETLDAIRLVMENQNVIVFIGIDHRIAFKAIERHYKDVSDGQGEGGGKEMARDYLGKIIQLPIRLQEPTVQELDEFINKRLFPDAAKSSLQEKQKSQELMAQQPKSNDVEKETLTDIDALPAKIEEEVKSPNQKIIEIETWKEMLDTEDEYKEFSDLAKKFGFSNPRQLLRLRNSYRFIKALELQKARKKNQELGLDKFRDLMRMLFWQEFLFNRPKDLRQACLKAMYEDLDAEKISDEQTKDIIKQVKSLVLESFKDKKIHDETEKDVRIVVLPHSQED